MFAGVMRVDACRYAHRRPQPTHVSRAGGFRLVAGGKDHQRRRDPRRLRARDHVFDVGRERFVGEMTVGVNHWNAE